MARSKDVKKAPVRSKTKRAGDAETKKVLPNQLSFLEPDPEKKTEKEAYYARKEALYKFEKENYEKVIIMRGMGGYWQVFGHSAIILLFKISKEVKLHYFLAPDRDFRFEFKEGMISIKNLEHHVTTLMRSSWMELEKRTKDWVVFKLKRRLARVEYTMLAETDEKDRLILLRKVYRTTPLPDLRKYLEGGMEIASRLYRKKSSTADRELFGKDLIDSLKSAHQQYFLVSRREIGKKEGLTACRKWLVDAMGMLSVAVELKVWSREDCAALSVQIDEAISYIEKVFLDDELKARSIPKGIAESKT